jgi:hypothetical protein
MEFSINRMACYFIFLTLSVYITLADMREHLLNHRFAS